MTKPTPTRKTLTINADLAATIERYAAICGKSQSALVEHMLTFTLEGHQEFHSGSNTNMVDVYREVRAEREAKTPRPRMTPEEYNALVESARADVKASKEGAV